MQACQQTADGSKDLLASGAADNGSEVANGEVSKQFCAAAPHNGELVVQGKAHEANEVSSAQAPEGTPGCAQSSPFPHGSQQTHDALAVASHAPSLGQPETQEVAAGGTQSGAGTGSTAAESAQMLSLLSRHSPAEAGPSDSDQSTSHTESIIDEQSPYESVLGLGQHAGQATGQVDDPDVSSSAELPMGGVTRQQPSAAKPQDQPQAAPPSVPEIEAPSGAINERSSLLKTPDKHADGLRSDQQHSQPGEGQQGSANSSKHGQNLAPAVQAPSISALLLSQHAKDSPLGNLFSTTSPPAVRRTELQKFMHSSMPDLDKAQHVCDELWTKQTEFVIVAVDSLQQTRMGDEVNEAMAILGWQTKQGCVSLCLIDCLTMILPCLLDIEGRWRQRLG